MDETILEGAWFKAKKRYIHLAKKSKFHASPKHIYVRYHWIRDTLNNKLLELEKIHMVENGSNSHG